MDVDDSEEEDEELPPPKSKKGKGKGKGKVQGKGKRKKDDGKGQDDEEEDEPLHPKPKRQRCATVAEDSHPLTPHPLTPHPITVYATPPSSQMPAMTTTPDAEAGARVTTTSTGTAQASASALISTTGDADFYATARSTGGATSTARAVVRGSGQQSNTVTSANINVDMQSAPPSPAKDNSQTQASGPSSSPPAPSQDNSSCPTLPPSSSIKSSRPRSSARSLARASDAASTASSASLPEWMCQMKTFLLSGVSSPEWVQSVGIWEELERGYGFVNTCQTLPTEARPDAVLFWTKRARKFTGLPPDVEVSGFGQRVVLWWNSMMPGWRTRSADGHWERSGEGDWGALRCPGQNGLLSIMACLRWWLIKDSKASVREADSSWQALFADVCWVMEELRKSEEHPVRKKARSE
ncbi:SERTA domain-containing protein 3 [Paramarasmius palmivorus]|uniref:SERTA domain-containing protein 3 n=1 Tax=Paramarasmius palmivorus TaxID=297713 RepID=A0AAW0D0H1_9AGAR